jgi:hypothetical protein
MPHRAILSVKYLAMPSAGTARAAVNGFVRYIQYRDHHEDVAANTSRIVRYVDYRDATSKGGQLFDRSTRAGDLERKALVAHVRHSLRDLAPGARPQRAVYRFVLSPADTRGLDLRELALATMRGLERDAGPLPPWVAAVHRNTQHPHVHIVMAARREVSPDRFKALIITRPRLARMKESLAREMSRQIDRSPVRREDRTSGLRELVRVDRAIDAIPRIAGFRARHRVRFRNRADALNAITTGLRRAARRYQRHIEQELIEEERRKRSERAWER